MSCVQQTRTRLDGQHPLCHLSRNRPHSYKVCRPVPTLGYLRAGCPCVCLLLHLWPSVGGQTRASLAAPSNTGLYSQRPGQEGSCSLRGGRAGWPTRPGGICWWLEGPWGPTLWGMSLGYPDTLVRGPQVLRLLQWVRGERSQVTAQQPSPMLLQPHAPEMTQEAWGGHVC